MITDTIFVAFEAGLVSRQFSRRKFHLQQILNGANGDEWVLHCYFGLDFEKRAEATKEALEEVSVVGIRNLTFFSADSVAFASFHIVQ